MTIERQCPVCDAPLKGRRDKKFCSPKCKSISQYQTRVQSERFYFAVDAQLKVNRKLLKRYNHKGYTTVNRADLEGEGFNPNFFTHYWKNQKGDVYLFVYDYGFLSLRKNNKDKYLIVEWQEYMSAGKGA